MGNTETRRLPSSACSSTKEISVLRSGSFFSLSLIKETVFLQI